MMWRIRGYFAKLKGVREQNILGNAGLYECTNALKLRSGTLLDFWKTLSLEGGKDFMASSEKGGGQKLQNFFPGTEAF